MSIRHIHTQVQAQAELERRRAAQRTSYAGRKERTLNGTPAQIQAELELQREARRASYARRNERLLSDAEYREQELQRRKISRDNKRKAMQDNPLHLHRTQDADRMAKVRRVARETRDILDIQEREDMIEKVHQRYFLNPFLLDR